MSISTWKKNRYESWPAKCASDYDRLTRCVYHKVWLEWERHRPPLPVLFHITRSTKLCVAWSFKVWLNATSVGRCQFCLNVAMLIFSSWHVINKITISKKKITSFVNNLNSLFQDLNELKWRKTENWKRAFIFQGIKWLKASNSCSLKSLEAWTK